MKKIILMMLCTFWVQSVSAASTKTITGKIKKVGTHLQAHYSTNLDQTGVFYFYMDDLPAACNTTQKRLAITTNHPLYNTISAMVLTAKAQDASITAYYLDTCTYRSDAWDLTVLFLN